MVRTNRVEYWVHQAGVHHFVGFLCIGDIIGVCEAFVLATSTVRIVGGSAVSRQQLL